MHKILLFIFFLLVSYNCVSQEGFQIQSKKNKISIPFQLINNLIVLPVDVNGAKLNFILDTGVEKTFLLSLEETDSVEFKNIVSIKIRGLGSEESINAYLSKKNTLKIKNFTDTNHEIYLVTDQDINFSAQLGIPVHGILGHEFLKNHLVEINYQNQKINIYKNKETFSSKKLKTYSEIPITLELGKPYIQTNITLNSKILDVKLLLDTGSSDSIWLFEDKAQNIQVPEKYFEDFLGRGFSGIIFGKKTKIDQITMGKYAVDIPNASFPDTLYTYRINSNKSRNGSVGSEIIKRFNTILDYKNQKLYLKKNSFFLDKFGYNMSGIEIQHNGVNWIKEEVLLQTRLANTEIPLFESNTKNIKYKFSLKPIYEITNVRKKSPAEKAGILKGDLVTKINNIIVFRFTLQEINKLLQSEEGRWINIEIKRNSKLINFKFQLEKLL